MYPSKTGIFSSIDSNKIQNYAAPAATWELFLQIKVLSETRNSVQIIGQTVSRMSETLGDKERCMAENVNKDPVFLFAGLKQELEESVEKCRSLQMETHQFKEQFK